MPNARRGEGRREKHEVALLLRALQLHPLRLRPRVLLRHLPPEHGHHVEHQQERDHEGDGDRMFFFV